jgi:SAM-dependent methyltransferase
MPLILRQKATQNNAYWDGFLSILNNFRKEGLFLEIGAASKERIEAQHRIFTKLIGLDVDFERMPKLSGVKMVNADAQSLPFKNDIFDGVVSHHVIEHIEKDKVFLGEIKRTLKNGGFAILGTPNRRRLVRVLIEVFTGNRRFPWGDHKREYTKQELLELGRGLSFQNVFVYSKFLGLHTYWIILGLFHYPRMFER